MLSFVGGVTVASFLFQPLNIKICLGNEELDEGFFKSYISCLSYILKAHFSCF